MDDNLLVPTENNMDNCSNLLEKSDNEFNRIDITKYNNSFIKKTKNQDHHINKTNFDCAVSFAKFQQTNKTNNKISHHTKIMNDINQAKKNCQCEFRYKFHSKIPLIGWLIDLFKSQDYTETEATFDDRIKNDDLKCRYTSNIYHDDYSQEKKLLKTNEYYMNDEDYKRLIEMDKQIDETTEKINNMNNEKKKKKQKKYRGTKQNSFAFII